MEHGDLMSNRNDTRHILFIAAPEIEGGATKSMYGLCKRLIETGEYRCTVLTSQHSWLNDDLEAIGARTVVTRHAAFLVPKPSTWWKVLPKYIIYLIKYLYGLLISTRIAESAVDFSEVDIIHTNVPRNDLGIILARRHGIPHVIHLRECSFTHFRCWSYRPSPVRYLNSGADLFIAISDFVRKYWEGLGISDDKVRLVYNGVTPPRVIQRYQSVFETSDTPLKVLFLGGYVEAKGIWDPVRAALLVNARHPKSLVLDVYGGGSPEIRREVMRFVEEHEAGNFIRLHGPLSDVWPEISAHDIGLACSTDEAFGRIVIEYQACGTVPVVSSSGAFPELVQDGINGLVYEKSQGEHSLAECLFRLVEDREKVLTLSASALKAAEGFTAERNCEEVQAIYDEILRQAPRNKETAAN
jgi:glycosyltransferase involved in cell wall biosynthesis